jgi:hypothetical protein
MLQALRIEEARVIHAGDARQISEAKKLLVATRRSPYEILAQDSSEDA